jgi:hypothetical protein
MQKWIILPLIIIAMLLLSACNSAAPSSAADTAGEATSETTVESGAAQESGNVRLEASAGDLSVQAQLALGTLQLEDTELAVDEALAAELLPLWQALQSLSNSDTTAEAELTAVVNQIQDTMNQDQIQAIAAMQLTEERLNAMIEEGELPFGGGFRGGAFTGDGDSGGGQGGPRGGDFFFGGPPGGGPGGGGPGGGFFAGGPEGGFGDLSEDDIATRQAQFEEGDFSAVFQGRILTGAVIRLLQEKTGDIPEQTPGGLFDTVFTIVGDETGLDPQEIREQLSGGSTLAEIIEANGGDLEAVRNALIEALGQLPNADEIDAEQLADEWLGLTE